MPCTLEALQDQAAAALEARGAAIRMINATLRPGTDDYIAACRALPSGSVRCGGIEVTAIVPQNRTMLRQAHIRYQYRVAGRLVSEAKAREALR